MTYQSSTSNNEKRMLLQSQSQSGSRIRSDLIFKLGVAQAAIRDDKSTATLPRRRREPSRGSMLGNVNITSEPLKYPPCERSEVTTITNFWNFGLLFGSTEPTTPLSSSLLSSSSSDELSSSSSSSCRKLTFNEEVKVCPIPKREEYSKRIREQLWASPKEMAMMAHRNTVEFAAEGWDYRNCLEDENMYRCVATNELIHPVHVEHQQRGQQTRRSE